MKEFLKYHKGHGMFRVTMKLRGRGAKFQWNTTPKYGIRHNIGRVQYFNTKEEAEKAWFYIIMSE